MKKTILVGFFSVMTLISIQVFSQTIQETKNFIKEQVSSIPSTSVTNNFTVLFKEDLTKTEADKMTGITLSNESFENLFVYRYDALDWNGNWLATVVHVIDIRDITSVSIHKTKTENGDVDYSIKVYYGNKYFSTKRMIGKNSIKELPDRVIYIDINDKEAVQRIKKAIIHLGSLYGVTVTDGDNLFQ